MASKVDYRDALDLLPDAVVASDAAGRVVYANDEALRLLGRARSAVVDRALLDFAPARLRACYARLYARAMRPAALHTRPVDVLIERPGGDGRVVEVAARAFRDGLLLGAREARNVGERARAHDRLLRDLEEAVHVRDEFLAIASHELRTPLTPLQLQVQSMQRSLRRGRSFTTGELLARLDSVGRQVARIERLVENLLDVARFTNRRVHLAAEDVELASVVRDVVARQEEELTRAGCTAVVSADAPVAGRWDRLRVDQIVTNLLSNAIKFGPGRPIEVRVESVPSRRLARIVVRDHGIGIRGEDQRRIFERFERAVPSHHYGGFGVGLWIVRQLVQAMGGEVTVESVPGSGATFVVELPQRRAEGRTALAS